ncbi:MAG TPA: DMT family transporter, partial [Tenuifilaceae bacterium]|nr:DMT family transporter [Tenuifilaceae bacterium]
NTIGALYFMPLFLIFDFNHFQTVGISWQAMVPVIKLGIFASTFAFMLFTYSIKHLGITRANTFSNAIPVLTAIFAYFLLDEALTPVMIAGILVVVSGLFLSQISPKTKTQIELKVLPEHPVVGIGLRLRKLFRK